MGDYYYKINFGKRSGEELYNVIKDPDCVINLANKLVYYDIKDSLWLRLENKLIEHQDPRILGKGEIFDYYPYSRIPRQQKLYNKSDYDPIKLFENKYNQKVNIN